MQKATCLCGWQMRSSYQSALRSFGSLDEFGL
jgi:hypothetical protein